MKVPFSDLPAQYAGLRDELAGPVEEVFTTGAFVLGPAVTRFENAFAAAVQRRHCVALNSGTSALHLALLAVGVGAGDEVVTSPFTWISTSWAVSYCGATPVFADVDPGTASVTPAAAAAVISDRTRALLPVDVYGNPAPLDEFETLASSRGLALVDDACQAHGSSLGGRPVGAFGDLACFSFYPGKNLGGAGEGGAVVTDDDVVAARLRGLRDHGQAARHQHAEIGFNYRMDGLQGAVLDVKLRHLSRWNEERRAAASRYGDLLGHLADVALPQLTPAGTTNWHLYVIRVPDRDRVAQRLRDLGIETGVHYPTPIHLQPAYASLGYRRGDFPNAESFAQECLSIPLFPGITAAQQEYVAEALGLAVSAAA